jgi:chromosome segregation ATPase
MWIWWIVSLIILIACIVFAYRMIVSSYEFLPADKKSLPRLGKRAPKAKALSSQAESSGNLNSRLQSLEETNAFHEIQFSKFLQRLKSVEDRFDTTSQPNGAVKKSDDEDWKEMYYEENERKEKLENELDKCRQQLETNEILLKELRKNNRERASILSNHDTTVHDIQSMQQAIEMMQRKIMAASEREKELEQLLCAEIEAKKTYSRLESEQRRLQFENEDLRRQIVDFDRQQASEKIRSLR